MFFGGVEGKPDFTAKIIHGDYKGGIIAEYMGYCRVYDKQRAALKDDPNPEKWIAATIDECIKKGFLVQYLTSHRTEVEKVMLEMYSPKYVNDAERKTEIVMDVISVTGGWYIRRDNKRSSCQTSQHATDLCAEMS